MKSLLFYRIKDLFLNIGEKWDKLSPSADDVVEFACLLYHLLLNDASL